MQSLREFLDSLNNNEQMQQTTTDGDDQTENLDPKYEQHREEEKKIVEMIIDYLS